METLLAVLFFSFALGQPPHCPRGLSVLSRPGWFVGGSFLSSGTLNFGNDFCENDIYNYCIQFMGRDTTKQVVDASTCDRQGDELINCYDTQPGSVYVQWEGRLGVNSTRTRVVNFSISDQPGVVAYGAVLGLNNKDAGIICSKHNEVQKSSGKVFFYPQEKIATVSSTPQESNLLLKKYFASVDHGVEVVSSSRPSSKSMISSSVVTALFSGNVWRSFTLSVEDFSPQNTDLTSYIFCWLPFNNMLCKFQWQKCSLNTITRKEACTPWNITQTTEFFKSDFVGTPIIDTANSLEVRMQRYDNDVTPFALVTAAGPISEIANVCYPK